MSLNMLQFFRYKYLDTMEAVGPSTSDQVVSLLNTAQVTASTDTNKLDNLRKVKEIIVTKDPDLLDNFLDEVLAFQTDRSQDVRKFVVGFIEDVCKKNTELLPKVIANLQLMLGDQSVMVQKRVIQAMTHLYMLALKWLAGAKAVSESMEAAWGLMCNMKEIIVKLLDSDNDGTRTMTVKFMEMVVLIQTHREPLSVTKEADFCLDDLPLGLKLARPRKLEEEARRIFDKLVKYHGSAHISSANLMTCMGSLTNIAKLHPTFMEKVITALEMLQANLPPTLAKSQVSNVRKHLKNQLLALLRHPTAAEHFFTNMTTLLTDLGAGLDEVMRAMPNYEEMKRKARKKEMVAVKANQVETESTEPKHPKIDIPVDEEEDEAIQIKNMDYSIDKALDEASDILSQAKEWSNERIEENASFVLECSRVVLSKSDEAGHEEKLECLKWLAQLADFVPGFNMETDVNKPFFEEVNRFLNNIYELLSENGEHGLDEMLITLIYIILDKMRKVVSVNSKLENVGAGDLPSLLKLVPLILIKTFQQLDNLHSPCDGWKIRAKEVMVVYFDIVESVQFRPYFYEEREILDITIKNLLTLQYLFVSLDRKFGLLASCVFGNLTNKFASSVEIEKYQKESEKICFKLGEKLVAAVKKLNCMNNQDLEFNMSSDSSSTQEIRELLLLLSEVSPLPLWLTLGNRDQVTKLVKEMLESGVFDPSEISVGSGSNVWKEFVDLLDKHPGLGETEDQIDTNNRNENDVSGETGSDTVEERVDTHKLFFQLSPSFPFTPMSLSACKSLPESFLKSSPPDLAHCCPIPGALGSFFILSSLSPIVNSKVITPAIAKGKRRKIKKMGKRGTSGLFEKKVLKSKLVSLNLQKQRLRNISRFNLLIKERNGIFKCEKCGMETGWKSKAWNHATRCGLVKKPARKRIKLKTCRSCNAAFKNKKDLTKHFQAEHQVCRYTCVLCSKPIRFKFKQNFRRHHSLKHSNSDARPVFSCKWCSYKASQRYNLSRHVTRVHKSVGVVSNVVDKIIEEAVLVIGLCEYERIRRDNIQEKSRLFESLFPSDDDKDAQKKPKLKKSNMKVDSQETGSSTRLGRSEVKNTDLNGDPKDMPTVGSGESQPKKFSCSDCDFKCSQKHSLKRHIVKKHQPLEEHLPCPRSFCNLSFSTRWEKEQHVPQCWLVCHRELCNGKRFRRPQKYEQHFRMHKRKDEWLEGF